MVNESRKVATGYYDKKREMAAFIENALTNGARPKTYFYYEVGRTIGLGKKHVDTYIEAMVAEGHAKVNSEGVVRKVRG
jgi:hypothetical protein